MTLHEARDEGGAEEDDWDKSSQVQQRLAVHPVLVSGEATPVYSGDGRGAARYPSANNSRYRGARPGGGWLPRASKRYSCCGPFASNS